MTIHFGYSATSWFGTFCTTIVLLVKKTLEDEWYVVIKVHTFSIIEDFFASSYTACPCYPYIYSLLAS